MSMTFIGIITAATMIITGLNAAPARAGGDDIAKILVGATALFIVGSAINSSNKARRSQSGKSYTVYTNKPAAHSHIPTGHSHYQPVTVVKRLPSSCLRNYRTSEGKHSYFTPGCLQKRYRQVSSLPQNCNLRVWTVQGLRNLYSPSCLRSAGFRWSAG